MKPEDFNFPQGRMQSLSNMKERGDCRLMIVQRYTGGIAHGMLEDFFSFDHRQVWANNSFNKNLTPNYHPLYASVPGSHATPSAGLFFTESMLSRMNLQLLTLHIGSPRNQPDIRDGYTTNIGWKEDYCIPKVPIIDGITAIGTTVVKTMETMARTGEFEGSSELFIQPPFEFKVIGKLLTNFHYAQECLLALTCAFGGTELIKEAYTKAVERNYLFGDYGDRILVI